jgi:type IV pilus assembly protein PilV
MLVNNSTPAADSTPAGNSHRRRSRGFSLVEVLVALVVCAIGLLGLAKMESLALSSTGVANSRSLAAIQASSLAAAMHANRAYWGAGGALASYTLDAGANNYSSAASTPCLTAGASACTPDNMAYYDLWQWGQAVQAVLPGYSATITCSTTGFPVNCTIQLQWVENAVAANGQQTNLASLQAPTYTVYVEP